MEDGATTVDETSGRLEESQKGREEQKEEATMRKGQKTQ